MKTVGKALTVHVRYKVIYSKQYFNAPWLSAYVNYSFQPKSAKFLNGKVLLSKIYKKAWPRMDKQTYTNYHNKLLYVDGMISQWYTTDDGGDTYKLIDKISLKLTFGNKKSKTRETDVYVRKSKRNKLGYRADVDVVYVISKKHYKECMCYIVYFCFIYDTLLFCNCKFRKFRKFTKFTI